MREETELNIEELKTKIDKFFKGATDEELIQALVDAGYEDYTGIDPRSLVLNREEKK